MLISATNVAAPMCQQHTQHTHTCMLTCTVTCTCPRFRVPEGFSRPLPSVADGGAAPTPHHLKLRIWKRKESGAVLEVRPHLLHVTCYMLHFDC
jgi:hypothetical protein